MESILALIAIVVIIIAVVNRKKIFPLIAMLVVVWVVFDSMWNAIKNAAHGRLVELSNNVNTTVGAIASLAVVAGGFAVRAVVITAVLDVVEAGLRLRNVVTLKDTSLANLVGTIASVLDALGKLFIGIGLAGGGTQAYAVGATVVLAAEVLKMTLLRTHSIAEYRNLLLNALDMLKSLSGAAR